MKTEREKIIKRISDILVSDAILPTPETNEAVDYVLNIATKIYDSIFLPKMSFEELDEKLNEIWLHATRGFHHLPQNLERRKEAIEMIKGLLGCQVKLPSEKDIEALLRISCNQALIRYTDKDGFAPIPLNTEFDGFSQYFKRFLKYLKGIGKSVPKKCKPAYLGFVVYFRGYEKPYYLVPTKCYPISSNADKTFLSPLIYNKEKLSQPPEPVWRLVGGYPPHYELFYDDFPE